MFLFPHWALKQTVIAYFIMLFYNSLCFLVCWLKKASFSPLSDGDEVCSCHSDTKFLPVSFAELVRVVMSG